MFIYNNNNNNKNNNKNNKIILSINHSNNKLIYSLRGTATAAQRIARPVRSHVTSDPRSSIMTIIIIVMIIVLTIIIMIKVLSNAAATAAATTNTTTTTTNNNNINNDNDNNSRKIFSRSAALRRARPALAVRSKCAARYQEFNDLISVVFNEVQSHFCIIPGSGPDWTSSQLYVVYADLVLDNTRFHLRFKYRYVYFKTFTIIVILTLMIILSLYLL